MRRLLALLLSLALLAVPAYISLADTGGEATVLTKDQMHEDLDFLSTQLLQNHYGFHELIDAETWDSRVDQVRTRVDAGISDLDFCMDILSLVASLGVSHTRAGITGDAHQALNVLPVQSQWFGGDLFVLATTKEYAPFLGQKIIAIAGIPVDQAFERFRGFISYDNEAWLKYQFPQHFICADYLKYLGFTDKTDEVELTFENAGGEQTIATIRSLSGALYNLEFEMVERARIPAAEQPSSIYFATHISDQALLVSYYSCQEDPNMPMASFIEQVAKQIEGGAYEKVIVDLRYNGGGNSAIFEPMILMLSEAKDQYGFTLYTMIGQNTYSSALMNAVQLKMRAGAILVGQPTGGSVNHYGEIKIFTLPHAPVTVSYTTKFFNMIPEYGIDSLKPDITVEQTMDNFLLGTDIELELILHDTGR